MKEKKAFLVDVQTVGPMDKYKKIPKKKTNNLFITGC